MSYLGGSQDYDPGCDRSLVSPIHISWYMEYIRSDNGPEFTACWDRLFQAVHKLILGK